jgi:IS5 family transposase
MYFVQHGFNLADAACEDALPDSTALRRFVGFDLGLPPARPSASRCTSR